MKDETTVGDETVFFGSSIGCLSEDLGGEGVFSSEVLLCLVLNPRQGCRFCFSIPAFFVSAVLAAEDNSRLAFSTVGEGGALGIQVGGGWVRPNSVRFGMGRD